jgi:DoxX-like family
MPTDTQTAFVTNGMYWAGAVVTGLAILFLTIDGAAKTIKLPPVMEAGEKLGVPPNTIPGIGIVLLARTAIFAIPKTAVLGAILLTSYLGGATAIHVRAGSGAFPVIFSIAFGALVWVGLSLREPRLLWTILLRQ